VRASAVIRRHGRGGGRGVQRASRALAAALFASALTAQAETRPAPSTPQWEAGYDGGFFFRSTDRRHQILLEGLFQVDLNLFTRHEVRTSDFVLQRMRPELAGALRRVSPAPHRAELQ
jgi:hypothetical protein